MRVENVVVANYSEDWAKEFEKIKTDIGRL